MLRSKEVGFSLECAVAVAAWLAVVALLVWGTVLYSMPVLAFGLALSAAAATVTIRMMLIRQLEEFERRMRGAYNLGREAGQRGESGLRAMRD